MTVLWSIICAVVLTELSAQTLTFTRVSPDNFNVVLTVPTTSTDSLLHCAIHVFKETSCFKYFFYNSLTKSCSAGEVQYSLNIPATPQSTYDSIYQLNNQVHLHPFNEPTTILVAESTEVNYTEAVGICANSCAHMSMFDTLDKFTALVDIGTFYWVGCADFDEDDKFHWTYDGSEVPSDFLNNTVDPEQNELSTTGVGNCCAYCPYHMKLHIRLCSENNLYICEAFNN